MTDISQTILDCAYEQVQVTPPHIRGLLPCHPDRDQVEQAIRDLAGDWAKAIPDGLASIWDDLTIEAQAAAFIVSLSYSWSSSMYRT